MPERERARALKMSSLSAQPACHKSRTYSVKLFADVTHENTQAPSVLLIHYCVWENFRNTQIPFQSVPLFSNGCMRFGFSLAPFFPPFLFHYFSAFYFSPCKSFFGCDFDVFLHCLSLSPAVRLFFFSSAFYFIPNILLMLFLDVLTTGRVKSSEDLELMQALKLYSESQRDIVFPVDDFYSDNFCVLYLIQYVVLLNFFLIAGTTYFPSCDQ